MCDTPTAPCNSAGDLPSGTAGWGNGISIPLLCQEQGTSYSHGGLTTDMYAKITYNGVTGYIAAYLTTTSTTGYNGLPIWHCS